MSYLLQKIKKQICMIVNQNDFFVTYRILRFYYFKKNNKNLHSTIDQKNRVLLYQTSHKTKELILKASLKEHPRKIKVVFIIPFVGKFGMETIYHEMEKSNFFEPLLLITHNRDTLFIQTKQYEKRMTYGNDYWEEVLTSFNYFQSRGYRVLLAYNVKTREPISLEDVNPDIVFFNYPSQGDIADRSWFKLSLLNFNYLTCYLPYGITTVDLFEYQHNNESIASAWKHFNFHSYAYYDDLFRSRFKGINSILTGCPKIDLYSSEYEDLQYPIPKKINNGKKIVIYAPHWTISTGMNLSTFQLYYQYFLFLLKQNPNINFVFKPHPDILQGIRDNQHNKSLITEKEYLDFYEEWNNSPNGICVEGGEYINLFQKSSCLITDSASFIAEYLPSGNPCIYLLNPHKKNPINQYTLLGKKILNSYYLTNNLEELKTYFKSVILEGKDPQKVKRIQLAEENLPNIGSAGKRIINYLTKILLS